MGSCSPPPISHLLLPTNNNIKNKTPLISKQPFIIVSSLRRRRIQRRQVLLLSVPLISLASTSCCWGASVFDPLTEAERAASNEVTRRVEEAVDLLEKGRDFQAKGDYVQALQCFTQVVTEYKDFALSEYARVGRALTLYEVGDKNQAIAEMEDVSISLKGSPEVHAALAAALYSDKHAPLLAENQFTIATLLDPKYSDLGYVKDTKHWPPSLVRSLEDFITLS
ncbi:Tetratricopeptide-like helical [Artemisia annua]|uniref:Tetratricopeptide-like helical n=1 Tax=Artemisia annua TaxID=35608 RepID=A0A2U1KD17_ARTAN|nr:Tetratricopeptide-like helical [Artemisia annua]